LDCGARALSAVHAHGFVHGDVKPANLIVSEDGRRVSLIDLGFARAPGFEARPSGTPDFMAPELFRGELSPAADVYALGVSVWQLLAPPSAAREHEAPAELLARALADPREREPLPSWVPAPLVELLSMMRAADRAGRPSQARELTTELTRLATALSPEQAAGFSGVAAESRSWKERALEVSALSLVGNEPARRALDAALAAGGAVAIVGPDGAGRSRVVRDAVFSLQLARAKLGEPLPTYRVADSIPARLEAGPSVWHVVGADTVTAVDVERFVRATEVEAYPSVLVLERTQPLEAAPVVQIQIGPLARTELAQLLTEGLGESARFTNQVVDEAAAVSGSLAARVCRALGAGLAEGRDLSRAGEWRRSVGAAAEGGGVSRRVGSDTGVSSATALQPALTASARALTECLCVAGGSLPQEDLERCFESAESLAEAIQLISALGLASRASDGKLRLRPDVSRTLWLELGEEQRKSRAKQVLATRTGRSFAAAASESPRAGATATRIAAAGQQRATNQTSRALDASLDASAGPATGSSEAPTKAPGGASKASLESAGAGHAAAQTTASEGAELVGDTLVEGDLNARHDAEFSRDARVSRGARVATRSGAVEATRAGQTSQALGAGVDSRCDAFLACACGLMVEAGRAFALSAQRALRNGDPSSAVALARESDLYLGGAGQTAEFSALLAEALRALGDYPGAVAVLAPWLEPRRAHVGPDRAGSDLAADSGDDAGGVRDGPPPSAAGGNDPGELLLLRAEISRLQGDGAGARAFAQRLLTSDTASAAQSLGANALLARLSLDSGDPERASSEARLVRDQAGDEPAGLRAAEVLSLALLQRSKDDEARAIIELALAAARARGARTAEARLWSVQGSRQRNAGQLRAAATSFARAFELADAAGEFHAAASFLVNLGTAQLDAGELGTALETLRDGARRQARLGRERDVGRTLYNLALARQLAGDYPDAVRVAERARAAATRAGDAAGAAFATLLLAETAKERGETASVADRLAALPDLAALTDLEHVAVESRIAVLYAEASDEPAASAHLAHAEAAAERAEIDDVELGLARAACFGLRRDWREAQREAERAVSRANERGEFALQILALSAAARAAEQRGDASLMRARLSELRAQLDTAALTLTSADRARLRGVRAYRAALSALPAKAPDPATPAADGGGDARFRRLTGIAKRLTAETSPRRLYELLLDAAIDLTHAENGFLMLRNAEGELRVRAGRTLGERDQAERSISHSIVSRVLSSGQALSTVDAIRDERLSGASSVHALALRSVLVVPLRNAHEILGVIYLDDRLRPFAFGDDEVALSTDLADIASIALEASERLRRERRAVRRLRATQAELARQLEKQAIELASWKGAKQLAGEHAGIVAHSPAMRETLELALRVARSDVPVLIRGESGTGKELIAKAIHAASSRKDAPFVSENCGAIPETLLESTLFGHVKGAFTGADRRHHGLFEAADGGTLFLDEIGEMSPAMQVRLLRVLQDGEVRPIGGERATRVHVRVLSATHRDVDAMLERGGFREDLFYRLAVVSLALPPLRERIDDILPLVQYFLAKYAPGRPTKIDKRVLEKLASHGWPGNVRQLENEIRRALALASGDTLREEHFSVFAQRQGSTDPTDLDLRAHVDELERKLIRRALDTARGNQTRAAELLGVSRFGLQKMLKRLFPVQPG
jgi:transcriptional regulator with GAF, ATPase, and Fis domain